MNCPTCGQPLEANTQTCTRCGAVLTQPQPSVASTEPNSVASASQVVTPLVSPAVPSIATANAQTVPVAQAAPIPIDAPVAATRPTQSDTLQYASFGARIVAVLIDILPSIAISAVSAFLFPPVSTIILYWLYYSFTTSSKWQGTIGKRVMGLKVVGINGEKIGFWRVTLRYFAFVFSTVLTIGLGLLIPIFTSKKQGIHDLIAHTVVIKK